VIEPTPSRAVTHAGYHPDSPWPGEDGGPLRTQVATARPGLGLLDEAGQATGATLVVTASRQAPMLGMAIAGAGGTLYIQGCDPGAGTSWLEQIDPVTLETVHRSPDLAGGPFWPGGAAVHANGDLYVTYGRWCHRLDAECSRLASRELPRDRPYNSLVILPSGHLVMKDFGGGIGTQAMPDGVGCEVVVLEPEALEIVARHELPEGSIARLSLCPSADPASLDVLVVGDTHVWRLAFSTADESLTRVVADPPAYRTDEGQGFGWDAVIGAGAAWFLDDGEGSENFGGCFHGKGICTAPLRLWCAPLDGGALSSVAICGKPGGVVANPPIVDFGRRVAVGYDSGNGVLAAWRFGVDGAGGASLDEAELLWRFDQDQAGHQVLFASGELVSFDYDVERAVDQIVVRHVETGEELGRVDTQSPLQHVLFPCATDDAVYTASFTTLSRLAVEPF